MGRFLAKSVRRGTQSLEVPNGPLVRQRSILHAQLL